VTADVIAALASALLPFREELEAEWAGKRAPARPAAVITADLLTIPAVAERLSCSRPHVYDLLAAGELVRRNISATGRSKARVTAASVEDYIRREQYRGTRRV
jgi:excisionase family DNA binding protein